MANELAGRRIAILATDGVEEAELLQPRDELRRAGAQVDVIAPKPGQIQGMDHDRKGQMIPVDLTLDEAEPADYDGLVLPGGVANPDSLRINRDALDFVEFFNETGLPVAAICHGPWILIEADMVRGRTMTSWLSLKTDLRNAGATWVDQEVVVDGNLITSRRPDDLDAFCREFTAMVSASESRGIAAE